VLFLYGNAGTGKTSVLTYLAHEQADRYLRGETSTLFLYLDAQGKGLSQLEDVMARTLQDWRAKFTYHSVTALTRRHCVIPIVDGFDELIGPSSAREAFSNLAQFLGQLDGEGALIASSRSAFLDVTTLFERAAEIAARHSLLYHIQPVEILRWGDKEVFQFADRRKTSAETKDKIKELLASRAGELLRKPFYLGRVCDILEEHGEVDGEGDLSRQVTEDALSRETVKLKDQRGKPLLTKDQHRLFCEMLADEMWAQGTPELDCETIRLLAEILAEQASLSSPDRKILVDRSIAHGLLVPVSGLSDKRAFEHELLRFEFQAGSLARSLAERGQTFKDYLQRAEIPLDVTLRVASFRKWTGSEIKAALDAISDLVGVSRNPFAAANGGSLVAALISDRDDLEPGMRFSGLYVRSFDLGASLIDGARVLKCVFERVNLGQARVERCLLSDSHFISCILTKNTSLLHTTVDRQDFAGLVFDGKETFEPQRIEAILKACGAETTGEGAQPAVAKDPKKEARVELAEKMLKHARTHYYLVRSDAWFKANLEGDADWDSVEAALRRHKLLEETQFDKSGRPEAFLRLTVPADTILQARSNARGTLPAAGRFWETL
jgi:hypothetical protein